MPGRGTCSGHCWRRLTTGPYVLSVVHIVVPEVSINGLMLLVGPDQGKVAAVPALVGTVGAHREAGLVDRGEHFDVVVLSEVVLPRVPLANAGLELCRSIPSWPGV